MNQIFSETPRPQVFKPSFAQADHCAILLGLYNGGANLGEQLASFLAQTHTNWSLVVSDDGSRDDGPDQVRAFATENPDHEVRLVDGPRCGFAANYLSLIASLDTKAAYAALSDQDDRWMPEKLERGIESGRPALYCGRTTICDASLRPLRRSPHFKLPPSFANAVVQNMAGGNTMILNGPAIALVREAAALNLNIPAHDWYIYQLISAAGGVILYDREPMVLYRQHNRNLIGANDGLRAQLRRLIRLLAGDFSVWNRDNIAALKPMSHRMTPEAREILGQFIAAREGRLASRLDALRASGIYRQTRRGTIALWLAAALNRL